MHQLPTAVGRLHPAEALCLRQHLGEAKDPTSGITYEVAITPGGQPHVRSRATGLQWTATWDDLIPLAIAAGINGPMVAGAPLPSSTHPTTTPQGGILRDSAPGAQPPAAQLAPPEGLVLTPGPAQAGVRNPAPPAPAPPHPFPAELDACNREGCGLPRSVHRRSGDGWADGAHPFEEPPPILTDEEREALGAPFGRLLQGELLARHPAQLARARARRDGQSRELCENPECCTCSAFDAEQGGGA